MRVNLYEPALAVDGKAYCGFGDAGDELYFPHVDSCCALIVVGDKWMVGGHMGAQLPNDSEPNYQAAGRYVWTLVHANHTRLNGSDSPCKIITIGESNWYNGIVQSIWSTMSADAVLPLRVTAKHCSKGVNVTATMTRVSVQPCESNLTYGYDVPDEFMETKDIGE
jgi:hypothetical protein